uniref:non-specific serine/threonine protein kinase n=1 Tax=Leersia perrieri TaxID=77586 RepID=A0A0D9W2U2_9ORYZ
MSGNVFLDSKFVDNNEEEYFTYTPFDKTVITICLLDVSGLIKQFLWVEELQDWELVFFRPKASCDVFSICGPFTMCNDNALSLCNCMKGFSVKSPRDWELGDRQEGCTRNTPLACSKNKSTTGLTDKFFAIPSVTLPYDAHGMEIVASPHECMQYNDTADNNEEILYLRLAAEEVQSWEHNKRTIIDVVAGVSVSAFSFLVFVLLLLIRRSKRRSFGHPMNKIIDGVGIVSFRYAHLKHATKNFSEKLGGGSFGSVFKGILSSSTTIAVKMLDGACQGEKQFRAEVSTIGMIQHVNLVKLIGFCCEGDRRMLVYEHMVNRSLDFHLFQSNGTILNWSTWYQIAIGVAKGLSYLHESCHDCIIHCDIKPENILLDVLFVPKVTDFGMAKLLGRDFSRILTTMSGTIGYLTPVWISGVAITQKVDVYSYGMVLLEIISGRRNTLGNCKSSNDQAVYFPVQAAHKLLNGDVGSLIDKNLHSDINMEEVERACKVACWCIQDDDFNRPTMGDVVQVLGLIELDMPQVPSLLIFLSCNTITPSSAQPSNRSENDMQALLCFKKAITNDPTGALSSWNSSLHFCRWKGVACGRTSPFHVVSIDLTSMELSGVLPACMGNLTSLKTLVLARNNLEGTIPESLAKSLSLIKLNLSRNFLTGDIPASLFNGSSKLITVDLQMNLFSGKISLPRSMGKSLQFLGLTGNFLSGLIPKSLANISSLNSVLLGQNNLSGQIPESLGQIANQSKLDLSGNRLSGFVPTTVYNMSSLEFFGIGNNSLIGKIPPDIGHTLPNLKSLIMSLNRFDGSIPASLANASNLEMLDLSSNLLSGFVPALGSLRNLNNLLLGNNSLEAEDWTFLTALTNCTQLLKLAVERNNINGNLPKSVGNLSIDLQWFKFGGNQISGGIPDELGNLINLTVLDINSNMLSGELPSTIGNLRKLYILNLSTNKLSGQIPSTVGKVSQLGKLYLDDNNLSGKIPGSIGQCRMLNMLNLSVNRLDGSIPVELVSISSLSLGLDLSNNKLSGLIPQEIGNLHNLGLLNFSNNQLSGKIPSSLSQCVVLLSLNMENNDLDGSIPESLSQLSAIQHIDLSENNLSGKVPTGGIFQEPKYVNLQGNKGLCANIQILGLPICPTSPVERKNNKRLLLKVVAPITIALFSVFCISFALVTLWKRRLISFSWFIDVLRLCNDMLNQCSGMLNMLCLSHEKRSEEPTTPISNEKLKKVSYGDILIATNWFSSIHTISSTHTGSVYVGRFKSDKILVAIKVFNLNQPGAYESYFIECEVLRSTRHRNLMRPLTLCSTLDKENHEFKALIFKFMVNGSLERWLYSEQHYGIKDRVLCLSQRICIATDVASALDYIHNHLTPPLVHCDVKPSNILLDDDMTARLGDFGSAKFLFPDLVSLESFADIGGTIGYMAPEYGMGCQISTGGDVYSFGVLLLEMLTGKKPTDDTFADGLSIHKFVDSMFPDRLEEILDPYMAHEEYQVYPADLSESCIKQLAALGLSCSMESPKDRPGMQDVCVKLCAVKEAFLQFSDFTLMEQ